MLLWLGASYLPHRGSFISLAVDQGKIEGRRRGRQRKRCLDGITNLMDMGLGELQELVMTGRPGVLRFMGSQRVGGLSNWIELN